jgi:hypothetical protein
MSEPTKADLAGELEKRVRQLETTTSENRGAKNLARSALGVAGASIIGLILTLLWAFLDLKVSHAVHGSQITQLEKLQATDIA